MAKEMTKYHLAIPTESGPKHITVPKEVYIYVKRLENCVKEDHLANRRLTDQLIDARYNGYAEGRGSI
jgi:hypothetical protein